MSQFKELIDPGKLDDTVLMAKDVVSVHGCLVRKHVDSNSPDSIQHAPFTLFPSPVPKKCFLEALAVQREVQLMLHNIAHDYQFLKEALASVVKVDEFTRNIWNIFETVTKENIVKPVSLAMIRSDYMIDSKIRNCSTICKNVQSLQTRPDTTPDTKLIVNLDVKSNASSNKTASDQTISSNNNINTDSNSADHSDGLDLKLVENFMESYESYPCDVTLKQVEVNTMSASFPGLAQNLHKYHRFIISKGHSPECNEKVPKNGAAVCFANGLITAWKSYKNEKAVILFLVFEVERNIYDQRKLEVLISKMRPEVKVIRRSLEYIHRHAYMNEKDRKLIVDNLEVAVVYQRSCYKPQDFSGGASLWKCRMMMERSQAIMCPSAGYHLAGTKKVQQVLSKPGMLERFVKDTKMRERIRSTFASQYELDRNPAGDKALQMAIENPNNFVVKPQREGGGNNTYGQDIVDLLTSIKDSDERLSFILMERISPMVVYNFPVIANETSLPTPCHSATDVQCEATPPRQPPKVAPVMSSPLASSDSSTPSSSSSSSSEDVLKQQKVKLTEMVSELGVYGVLVGSKSKIIMNEQCGYLLRTKNADTNEGGVATGYSVLDSPYLLD